MRVGRAPAVLALVALLAGCAGSTPFEGCVEHSVEEGLARSTAEQACRDAGLGS